MSVLDELLREAPQVPVNAKAAEIEFWFSKYAKSDKVEELQSFRIDQRGLNRLIYALGYARLDHADGGSTMVKYSKGGTVFKEVTRDQVIDAVFDHTNRLHDPIDGRMLTRERVLDKLTSSVTSLFAIDKLHRIRLPEPPQWAVEGQAHGYRFFQNGYLHIDKNGAKLHPYDQLQGAVWEGQIIKRDYHTGADYKKSHFYRFLTLVAGGEKRAADLMQVCGYLMHSFMQTKLKAVVLTDSGKANEMAGRSGKGILAEALGYSICNDPKRDGVFANLNGKNFEAKNRFRYQGMTAATRLICLNDIKRNFDPEILYNDITEGIEVERKGLDPFKVHPKILIATNRTLKTPDESSRDRFFEFEFTRHFHMGHQPADEFKHWFFRDWDGAEWARFDALMSECLRRYIEAGKLPQVDEINLAARKLVETTSEEFVQFMEDMRIKTAEAYNREADKPYQYDKAILKADFVRSYPDFEKITARTFNTWLQVYTDLHPAYKKYDADRDSYRSDGNHYIFFRSSQKPQNP